MVFSVALYATVVAGMLASGSVDGVRRMRAGRIPVLTMSTAGAIGVVSIAQLSVSPAFLSLLERDASRVRHGQPWRLITALLVQDGGWLGAVFNLVSLVVIGIVAERALSQMVWCAAFFLPAITGEAVGLWWQPVGGGNSIAVAGLCGAVAVASLRQWSSAVVVLAVVSTGAFAWLAWQHDIHGAAGIAGLFVGLLALHASPVPKASRTAT